MQRFTTRFFVVAFALSLALTGSASVLTDQRTFVPVSANYVYPPSVSKAAKAMQSRTLADVLSVPARVPSVQISAMQLKDFTFEVMELRILENDLAVSAGYLGASALGNKSRAVILESWRKYVPVEEDNTHMQYGVAVNMVTRVDYSGLQANSGGLLGALRADIGFRKLSVTVSVEVLGLSAEGITASLPTSSDLIAKYREILVSRTTKVQQSPLSAALELASPVSESFRDIRSQVWDVGAASQGTAPTAGFTPLVIGVTETKIRG